MSYRPRHFKLYELVDPRILTERGDRAWELLRPDMLQMLDAVREKFGPIVINDRFNFKESGLRAADTATGAKWSMHKFGGAFDLKPQSCTPRDVFDYVLAHPDEFPHITAMEDVAQTKTWLHVDCRNHYRGGIWVVHP